MAPTTPRRGSERTTTASTSRKTSRDATSIGGKSVRTQERLLEATAQVLSRKGYAGTRLSEIAEVAGLQAPAIYYYYASREELIEDVIRRGQERTQEHVEAALAAVPPGATALDKICVAVEAHLRAVLHLSDFTTAAIRNIGQMPDDMRKRLLGHQTRYGALWRKLFVEARDHGEIRLDLDLHSAQLLVIGALNWAPEWWTVRRGSVDTVVHAARTIVRNGLSTHPST